MKTEAAKRTKQKALPVTPDSLLDKLSEEKVLFPEKLAQANEFLANYPFPEHLKKQNAKSL